MKEINSASHEMFLYHALTEAKKRRGFCAPHPSVGAVAVHQGQVIAQAFHHSPGEPHAEVAVLSTIPPGIENLSLYVTLEPCNHWGKTPPCVKAILDYGVETVIFGFKDPHIHVPENDTFEILKSHGVKVIYHPLPEITKFYQSYQHWVNKKRPFITAKWAQSFDAKVGFLSARAYLTNTLANQFTHRQRSQTDVILTSANTILIDDPKLNVRLSDPSFGKIIAVLDTHLRLTGGEQFFKHSEQVHIFHAPNQKPTFYLPTVIYHPIGQTDVGLCLQSLVIKLAELGFHDVWLEAGPTLMAAMHEEKLVQVTHIFLVPTVLGKKGIDAYQLDYNFFSQPFELQSEQMDDNILTTFIWQEQ